MQALRTLFTPRQNKWLILAVAALANLGVAQAQTGDGSAPLAGSSIRNRAYVTFDVGNQPVRIDSNEVTTAIAGIAGLTLTPNNELRVTPGANVSLPHRLVNTGNISTAYFLNVENLTGDAYNLSNLQVSWDANGNGTVDAGEISIAPNQRVNLQPGQGINLVVSGSVPSTVAADAVSRTRITARVAGLAPDAPTGSTLEPLTASNVDTLTTVLGAAVTVRKSASTATSAPGNDITFTVVAQNSGTVSPAPQNIRVDGALAQYVVLRDVIPANTTFLEMPAFQANAVRLYHRDGTAPDAYTTAPPADLAQVDVIALGLRSLEPQASATLVFRVRVNRAATGSIQNVARLEALQPVSNAPYEVPSNVVEVDLPKVPPTLNYYTGETYQIIAGVTRVNRPLFLQGSAGACNQDPQVAEVVAFHVRSTLTGDTITVDARETGPNTGIFRVIVPIPTSDGEADPANGSLEIRVNDKLDAMLEDCGGARAVAVILVDPFGVVFNSRTNAPVAGARVTLIDVTGSGNGGNAGGPARVLDEDGVTPAPSVLTTGADGIFRFPLVAASTYRFAVVAPATFSFPSKVSIFLLPTSRKLDTVGSFGGNFNVSSGSPAVQIDVPIDPPPPTGLFLEKTASRRSAAIADFVDYELRLRNNTGTLLTNVIINDVLPRGFSYVPGTARRAGAAIADPEGGRGLVLRFPIGSMLPDDEVRLTYRVRIGAGVGTGDQLNRAQANGTTPTGDAVSNTASAPVRVDSGLMADRSILFGKVFVDANNNREQDPTEPGVPGVRIWVEDGTYALTDSEGKYSLYGLTARTHVVRLDKITLPAGAKLSPLTVRHAGRGESAFADLLKGQMHKVNFALVEPTAELLAVVEKRRKEGDPFAAEVEPTLSTELRRTLDDVAQDVRSRPSTGTVSAAGAVANSAKGAGYESLAPQAKSTVNTSPNGNNAGTFSAAGNAFIPGQPYNQNNTNLSRHEELIPAAIPAGAGGIAKFEAYVAGMDNSFAILSPSNNEQLPIKQMNVRLKGQTGAAFVLRVNGQTIPESRIGARLTDPTRQLQAFEYIGIGLRAGENVIEAAQLDPFGNERGTVRRTVIAPGDAGRIVLDLPKNATADGVTPILVTVRILDAKGVPVTSRTPVTLETVSGRFEAEDLNPREPGLQIFVSGGSAQIKLLPPSEPGEALIRATSGVLDTRVKFSFLPELRPLLMIGSVEGGVNAYNFRPQGVSGDLFQDDLRRIGSSGNNVISGRTALFLKGRVLGRNLLTLRYDSEQTRDKLFRDIQPDEYYPIYGDGSQKGFDAQSTGRLYVRLDRERNYFLFGDFTTANSTDTSGLANYQRSLTGARQHLETDRYKVDFFASKDDSRQIVDEFRANGTSGGYLLRGGEITPNSERVEIIIRDRNNPGVILEVRSQTRFRDYTVDYVTGRLLFKDPVPSVDANFNPVSIRVFYEVATGGPRFWVQGINGAVKITPNLEIGGSLVRDQDPQNGLDLQSLNATYKFGERTTLTAEMARTERDSLGSGTGRRVEVLHEGAKVQARFFTGRTSANFDNPGSILSRGRSETSLRTAWRLGSKTRLLAEAIRTSDVTTGNKRTGWQSTVERTFGNGMKAELGIRHAKEANPATGTSSPTAPVDFTSILSRLTVPVGERASLFGEYETDISDTSKRVLAGGGDYKLNDRSRVYARHEFISTLSGRYALNDDQTQQNTVIGIDTSYSPLGHFFSEYRIRDALAGRDGQAAIGFRDGWDIREGVRLSALFERTKSVGSSVNGASNDSTALGAGLEYTASQTFKGSGRVELRRAQTSDTVLATMGAAARLNPRFSLLSRGVFNLQNGRNGGEDAAQHRFQLGLAYRDPNKDRWNGLLKYEFRHTKNGTASGAILPGGGGITGGVNQTSHLFSANANYQANARTTIEGHYAAKVNADTSNGINSRTWAQLAGTRVIYELSRRTEVSAQAAVLWSAGGGKQYGAGVEVGRMIGRDLWLSAGYNLGAVADGDLSGNDYTRKGAYLRIRLKFDESLLGMKEAKLLAESNKTAKAGPATEIKTVEIPVIGVDPVTQQETPLPVTAEVQVQPGQEAPASLAVNVPATAPQTAVAVPLQPRLRDAQGREWNIIVQPEGAEGPLAHHYLNMARDLRAQLAPPAAKPVVRNAVKPVIKAQAKMQPAPVEKVTLASKAPAKRLVKRTVVRQVKVRRYVQPKHRKAASSGWWLK